MAKKSWIFGTIGLLLAGPAGAAAGALLGHQDDKRRLLRDKVASIAHVIESIVRVDDAAPKSTLDWIESTIQARAAKERPPPALLVASMRSLLVNYLRRTPRLMQGVLDAASTPDLAWGVETLLFAATDYFEKAEDLIPDERGLVGFLDDAYFANRLLDTMTPWLGSAQVAQKVDLGSANRLVRLLLPEVVGEQLDSRVKALVEGSEAKKALQKLLTSSAQLGERWNATGHRIDFKKEIVRDSIYHDLANEGIFIRPCD